MGSCLLEAVVRMRRLFVAGMRSNICSRSWVIVVVEGRGSDNVDGSFSPGNEVSRTLTVDEDILVVIDSFAG